MPKVVRVIVYDYINAEQAKDDMQRWNLSPQGRKVLPHMSIYSHLTLVEGDLYCSNCGTLRPLHLSLLCDDCIMWLDKQTQEGLSDASNV